MGLGKLIGTAPPADPGRAGEWMAQHAPTLLLFFGRFEEVRGAAAFPRFKIRAGGRYDVGHYRKVLVRYLEEQIEALAAEARGCRCPGE